MALLEHSGTIVHHKPVGGGGRPASSRIPRPHRGLRAATTIASRGDGLPNLRDGEDDAEDLARVEGHSADIAGSNQRTRNQFRPRVAGKGGSTAYQLRQYAEATLGGGSLRKVVKLPEGEDENEWLAVNSEITPLRSTGNEALSRRVLRRDKG